MISNRAKLAALTTVLLMAAPLAGTAQAPPAPAAPKVGIVNIQNAILATNEGKKELDALNQRYGPRSNALKTEGDAFEKDKAALQAQADKLNETERNSRIKEISERQKSLQRKYEDFQGEVQQAEQDMVNRIGEKMVGVLQQFAQKNGYSVILDVSNPQTPVLWFAGATDITKELVAAYNTAAPSAPPHKPAAARAPAARPPAGSTTPKKP